MEFLASILPWIQISLSVILIGLILLQQSDAGLGATFGGGDGTGSTHTRRGAEKTLFHITIVVAILFAASAAIALVA